MAVIFFTSIQVFLLKRPRSKGQTDVQDLIDIFPPFILKAEHGNDKIKKF